MRACPICCGSCAVVVIPRGDLLSALLQLDKEDDVNKVLRYFSYEHFYVIYCKVIKGPPQISAMTSGNNYRC